MQYQVTHRTHYDYGALVPECFNIVRLSPRDVPHQISEDSQLIINPQPDYSETRTDFFGNPVRQFAIHSPHVSLTVTASNRITVKPRSTQKIELTPAWETIAGRRPTDNLDATHFTYNSPHIRRRKDLAEYAEVSFTKGRPIAEAAMDLTSRIHADFEFDSEATTVSTPVEEVFAKKAGVCQDFAHFQIACLRSLNLPARYVSGYLRTLPPPGKARLIGADASHAWVSVYVGGNQWIDFDPTNNVIPVTDHLTIAWGRDYSDVCPIQGVFIGGGKTVMGVSVDVAPVGEPATGATPR